MRAPSFGDCPRRFWGLSIAILVGDIKPRRKCQRFQLWSAIGIALHYGLWSFFIDAGPNVTIRPRFNTQWS